ncbi:3-phosphoshikimate 1-carboxyvinyltransferase [Nitratifractor salsuginis]|uniref:3-phosphoshikimate 1-carboxyvinyltransferase n=1 Tax=Nitratifractor salsuginis (strain DSM 16511 / JCM 12458 / E9I37-1) TaxID=749222 RepID=E6WZU2_NITSE|nr:3-phosphoshikimate 1-carboxyvinyltransferase [Nitratifractor salsuginis]ADV45600.1 3-phosphoshikimate 1-carboxyvinyltransferase [Nitratifractor salsuginis DSM 16511]
MSRVLVSPCSQPFDTVLDTIAPDKSISHRCAMFSLFSDRPSTVRNFLKGEDTLASLSIARQLGAEVEEDEAGTLRITPPVELREPDDILDCGNAGTGMRLYCGLLAGVEGSFVLTGDRYLRSRPMKRVTGPLQSIGAKIDGREEGNLAPLHIRGGKLKAFRYESPIDSAQVKSAMILAALRGDAPSYYRENFLSRDHTERMLRGMGASIETDAEGWIVVKPLTKPLNPLDITVPADPSSAFFFAVAAAIVPGAKVRIPGVTLNPTRIEAYKVLEAMGAAVEYALREDRYEPIGEIRVAYDGRLSAVEVSHRIAWLIDELPALAVAMATAEGVSRVRNAAELRVKESDRIATVVTALKACGIEAEEYPDGYAIRGGTLRRAVIDSHGDHRIAMSFAIAGLLCGMEIEDIDCVATSFPNFFEILSNLTEVTR